MSNGCLILYSPTGIQHYELHATLHNLTIGRNGNIKLFPAEDLRFSRIHSELSCVDGQWFIYDESCKGDQKKRGTWVNDKRLANEGIKLSNNDRIHWGSDVGQYFAYFRYGECYPTLDCSAETKTMRLLLTAGLLSKLAETGHYKNVIKVLGTVLGFMSALCIELLRRYVSTQNSP